MVVCFFFLGWLGQWQVVICDVGQGSVVLVCVGLYEVVVVDIGLDLYRLSCCLDDFDVVQVLMVIFSYFYVDYVDGLNVVYDYGLMRVIVVF